MCQVRWDSVLSRKNSQGWDGILVCALVWFIKIIVVMILIMMNQHKWIVWNSLSEVFVIFRHDALLVKVKGTQVLIIYHDHDHVFHVSPDQQLEWSYSLKKCSEVKHPDNMFVQVLCEAPLGLHQNKQHGSHIESDAGPMGEFHSKG